MRAALAASRRVGIPLIFALLLPVSALRTQEATLAKLAGSLLLREKREPVREALRKEVPPSRVSTGIMKTFYNQRLIFSRLISYGFLYSGPV